MASEERLTSPATIGSSAMYAAAANRCGLSITTKATFQQMARPSEPMLIAAVWCRRASAKIGRDPSASAGARQVDVIGHQTIGPD
jgi:hypothetical protein